MGIGHFAECFGGSNLLGIWHAMVVQFQTDLEELLHMVGQLLTALSQLSVAQIYPSKFIYVACSYDYLFKEIRCFLNSLKGTKEDEMVGWHHRLDGHEFE